MSWQSGAETSQKINLKRRKKERKKKEGLIFLLGMCTELRNKSGNATPAPYCFGGCLCAGTVPVSDGWMGASFPWEKPRRGWIHLEAPPA